MAQFPSQLFDAITSKRRGHQGSETLLRHADVTTTLNIYTEAVPENLRAAHNRAAAQILGSQPWLQAEGTA
jgi:hypothetical protein